MARARRMTTRRWICAVAVVAVVLAVVQWIFLIRHDIRQKEADERSLNPYPDGY